MKLERPMFPPTRRAFINTIAALPIAASAPAAAAQTLDAGLIELSARFEPLFERYYVAQRRWSVSLAQAHAGLKDKMAATGYELPNRTIVDEDDEGEEA
jgi:hypothetical protein